MWWFPLFEVVESEEKQAVKIGNSRYKEHWRRQPHPQFTAAVLITGEVESRSIGKDKLVSDKDRVGKVMVGSVEGFIQLVPDVVATDIGANTGTLKLGIAVCTAQVLLGSATTNKGWQQQAY